MRAGHRSGIGQDATGPDCSGMDAARLILIAGLVLIPDGTAWASDRAQLMLRGVVPAVCSVSVSTPTVPLDLVRGQMPTPVASVEERCNAAGGYRVSVTSRNGGQLRSEGQAMSVGYSLAYDETAAGHSGGLMVERAPSAQSRRGTLSVAVPASPTLPAAEYQDLITITIAAK